MEREGVGAGEVSTAGRKGCILWSSLLPLPGNKDPLGRARLAHRLFTPTPQKQKHILVSLPQHKLGEKQFLM